MDLADGKGMTSITGFYYQRDNRPSINMYFNELN